MTALRTLALVFILMALLMHPLCQLDHTGLQRALWPWKDVLCAALCSR